MLFSNISPIRNGLVAFSLLVLVVFFDWNKLGTVTQDNILIKKGTHNNDSHYDNYNENNLTWEMKRSSNLPNASFRFDNIGTHDNDIMDENDSTMDEADDPNQYSVLMIHYHKTGQALTSDLKRHITGQMSKLSKMSRTGSNRNKTVTPLPFTKQHQQKSCKDFSKLYQRRHFETGTKCTAQLRMKPGCLHKITAPELYCNATDMVNFFFGGEEFPKLEEWDSGSPHEIRIGAKIIHFVRNPYSMAMSNYFYHAQEPTPEPWVLNHNPCKLQYEPPNENFTLKDLIFPTLSLPSSSSDSYILTPGEFDNVTQLCHSLYQATPSLKNSSYEVHLHTLNPLDGLRLATAQFMIRGAGGNIGDDLDESMEELLEGKERTEKYTVELGGKRRKVNHPIGSGGDLLRMANNIIKLNDMLSFLSSPHSNGNNKSSTETSNNLSKTPSNNRPVLKLATVAMDDFIQSPYNFTMNFQKILLSTHIEREHREQHEQLEQLENYAPLVSEDELQQMAHAMASTYEQKKSSGIKHVTSGRGKSKEEKELLKQLLREDLVLGPILDRIESLVERVLMETKEVWGF